MHSVNWRFQERRMGADAASTAVNTDRARAEQTRPDLPRVDRRGHCFPVPGIWNWLRSKKARNEVTTGPNRALGISGVDMPGHCFPCLLSRSLYSAERVAQSASSGDTVGTEPGATTDFPLCVCYVFFC